MAELINFLFIHSIYLTLFFCLKRSTGNVAPFKDALSGLRPLLGTESPLKNMKNGNYFSLKSLFLLKIF